MKNKVLIIVFCLQLLCCNVFCQKKCLLIKDGIEIQWGQTKNNSNGCNPSFNKFCPSNTEDEGQCDRMLAGCGAIASGQIMCMWKFPSKSKYRTYNWDNINAVLNQENADDCPHLVRDIGEAANMHYQKAAFWHINGSWCTNKNLKEALEEFSYTAELIDREDWTKEGFEKLIRTEIDCGRPVIMYGKQGSIKHSHYFVINGYDKFNPKRFYINWGWRGDYNGYYSFDSTYYKDDGDKLNYPDDVSLIYGISPKRGTKKISYKRGNKYIVPSCKGHRELTTAYFEVEGANSWEVKVYDRNQKLLWKDVGLVENGRAYVWNGSNFLNNTLPTTDYWLTVRLRNNEGEDFEFVENITYMNALPENKFHAKYELVKEGRNVILTPNCKDGVNDEIKYNVENITGWESEVYDRTGKVLCKSSGEINENGEVSVWDGSCGSRKLSLDRYWITTQFYGECGYVLESDITDFYYYPNTCPEKTEIEIIESIVEKGNLSHVENGNKIIIENYDNSIQDIYVYNMSSICVKKVNNCTQSDYVVLEMGNTGIYVLEIVKENDIRIEKVLLK